tara:strand:- start:436 stop:1692 length:1257 start_codon:yes stop_codon:yes gene_type:complete
MLELFYTFILEMWALCLEMAPFLMLGMFVSGIISIFVDSRFILKHIGSNNFSSILKSTVMGIPIPLCSCGVIPVAATLREAGASKGSTVSFLVSTPQTGIDSIFLTYGMLGPIFAIFRPLAAFISGLFSGMVINHLDDDVHHHLKNPNNIPSERKSLLNEARSGIKYGFLTLPADIVVPLSQGLIIATLIGMFIPPDLIASYFSSSLYILYFLMLAVSLPLYVCATASIPIAVVLMSKGIPAGAVFVFLMAGPATNASSIAVIKNILGTRTLYQYLALISLTAIVFGAILDFFFTIILPGMENISHVHGNDSPFSIFLTIIFLLILANSYRYSIRGSNQENEEVDSSLDQLVENKISLKVGGMTCSHCKESVENAVKSCEGVQNVSVDLLTGMVEVGGSSFDDSAIQNKIKSIGFELK